MINAGSVFSQRYDIEGEIILGEGAKGTYSLEQAEIFALAEVPGEVLLRQTKVQRGDVFHVFQIQTEDGSVFKVEIRALNGALHEIEVEQLSDNPFIPSGVLPHNEIKERALAYVKIKTRGKLPAMFQRMALGVYKRKLVYKVIVKKTVRVYELTIDAFKGDVLHVKTL